MTKARNLSLLSAVEAGATTDQTKADIDALGINGTRKNWIINGNFQMSQRGAFTSATALTTSSVYHLDRFKSKINGISGTLTHKLNQVVNGKTTNTMLLTATSAATGRVETVQQIEATAPFVSQTIAFSAWVKSNNQSARIIIHQNGANIQTSSNQHTGGGAFELLKGTVTCAANSGDIYLYAGIQAAGTGNVSVANGDYFEMAFAQVEYGSVATDFEHRSYGEELSLCQRYYEKSFSDGVTPSNGTTNAFSTTRGVSIMIGTNNLGSGTSTRFKVTKRGIPTIVKFGNSSGHWAWQRAGDGAYNWSNNVSPNNIGANGFSLSQQVIGGTFVLGICHWTADSEL